MEEQAEKFRAQKSNNNLLIVASARGYLADVEALIERGAELGCRDRHSMTPLHYAAAGGRLSVVEALLSRGAEVDPEAPDGRTPLHLAALRGHSDTIRALARAGAWLGAFDGADCSPLHLAARHGRLEAVETLLSVGADPSSRNRYGLRPVDEASIAGQLDAATALQRAGGGASDARSMPELLPFAAGLGRLAGVRSLLADGADVNGAAPDGTTALHAAALAADPDVTALLLESRADPAICDVAGQTPGDVALRAQRDAEEARQRAQRDPPPLRKPWPPVPPPLPATNSEEVILLLDVVGKEGQDRRKSTDSTATTEAEKLPHSFTDLEPRERLRKIERWATMRRNGKNDDLESALRDLPPEVRAEVESRLASIAEVDAHLNIHKAVCAFHVDVDFQADAARSEVQDAINEIQADPSTYEARIANPLIAGVFGKLRQIHAVCTANGQRKVELAMLLVEQGKEEEVRKNDALILTRMEAARQAHVAAAAAAATTTSGDPAAAAAAMYDAVVEGADQAFKDQEKENEERSRSSRTEPSRAEIQELEDDDDDNIAAVHPTTTRTPPSQKKRVRFAQENEEAELLVQEEEEDPLDARTARLADPPREAEQAYEDLPEWMKGPFSWAKVWDEFKRQCKQALIMLLIMLVVLTLLRRELPWVPNQGPRPGSVQEGAGHQEL